ncbi:CoA transferase [Sphingomonas sp.]|uniref:CaiB/BaiF CoA-transferase family protein n=1 Tax=Sphingomonas sp. TaxID=28214 RepID=UPI003CC6CD3E
MSSLARIDRPLAGIRIVDAVMGPLAPLTRYLAELGARVDRIVPVGDDPIADLAANNGKRRYTTIDGQLRAALLDRAHAVVFDDGAPADVAELRARGPELVTMRVSDFGTGTEHDDWQATDAVLHALSGELSRSGIRGREPLLPPGQLAYQCAAAQGAFVLVTAIYRALRTRCGDHLDFSALDGAVQALDPGYGISGSATMGKPAHLLSRDRPVRGVQYPIFPCTDGYVRICLLAKRQWQGMFRWLGEPPAFAGPEFDKISTRYKSTALQQAIGDFFSSRSRSDLEREGQRHGVPISAVLTFEECLATGHLKERKAFASAALADGSAILLPNGCVEIDGVRMGPTGAATLEASASWPAPTASDERPFAGLRVLDLGVIVVGAELGRLLADGGADVVKVESRDYPDGNRQSYLSYGLSVSFAAGHRNKRSLGMNLRNPAGHALFLELAKNADLILSNFKPGTMESLGLSYEAVAAVNPAIIMTDSSAFGSSGAWSGRMGYGPLVRAATGLTLAWRYPGDAEAFCDSVTIYPDHVAGRVGAIAAVALLIRRLRTGRGGHASVAQSEVMLAHFAEQVARASRSEPGAATPDWPWAVYRCAGDDEWCVVTVRDTGDWLKLAGVIGYTDAAVLNTPDARRGAKVAIDQVLAGWLAERPSADVMIVLQAAGVPAARMLRVADLPDFTYYRQRELFRVEQHPYLEEDVVAERWTGKGEGGLEAPRNAAPLMGEHSASVVRDWLGDGREIQSLIVAGVLEPLEPHILAAASSHGHSTAAAHA